MELLVAADSNEDQQVLQDNDGAQDHNDNVKGGKLFFILNELIQLLTGHILSKGIIGADQTRIVVLGIFALHGDRVAKHNGFTTKIHSHSGVVQRVYANNHCL